MIIETHGKQHYCENTMVKNLQDEQENDRLKKEMALKNNIDKYIVIDCSDISLNNIKKNITNSMLNELFDLSKIDWLKCEEYSLKNLVKEVCDYWDNKDENETVKDLEAVFNLSNCTIKRYLNYGVKHYGCLYDGKLEIKKNAHKVGKSSSKTVRVFKDEELLGEYESCLNLEKRSEVDFGIKFGNARISNACLNNVLYKGYKFEYVEK